MFEEQGSSKLKCISQLMEEELPFDGLFSKLVNFSSYLGMLVGFEEEIINILRKMETRGGCGVNFFGGKGS